MKFHRNSWTSRTYFYVLLLIKTAVQVFKLYWCGTLNLSQSKVVELLLTKFEPIHFGLFQLFVAIKILSGLITFSYVFVRSGKILTRRLSHWCPMHFAWMHAGRLAVPSLFKPVSFYTQSKRAAQLGGRYLLPQALKWTNSFREITFFLVKKVLTLEAIVNKKICTEQLQAKKVLFCAFKSVF